MNADGHRFSRLKRSDFTSQRLYADAKFIGDKDKKRQGNYFFITTIWSAAVGWQINWHSAVKTGRAIVVLN